MRFVSVVLLAAGLSFATEQLPLNVGNTWSYKDSVWPSAGYGINKQSIITISLVKSSRSSDTLAHIFTIRDSGIIFGVNEGKPYTTYFDTSVIDTSFERNGLFSSNSGKRNVVIYNDFDTTDMHTHVSRQNVNDTIYKMQSWNNNQGKWDGQSRSIISNQYFGPILRTGVLVYGVGQTDTHTTLLKFNNVNVKLPNLSATKAYIKVPKLQSPTRQIELCISRRSRTDRSFQMQLNGRMCFPISSGVYLKRAPLKIVQIGPVHQAKRRIERAEMAK